jgi:hypothetical protein
VTAVGGHGNAASITDTAIGCLVTDVGDFATAASATATIIVPLLIRTGVVDARRHVSAVYLKAIRGLRRLSVVTALQPRLPPL